MRSVEFATTFSSIGGVHGHEVLVRISEGIDGVVLIITEFHSGDAFHKLDKLFVPLGYRSSELVAIHIDIVEQSFEIVFACCTLGRSLDVPEHSLKSFVKVLVCRSILQDVAEQFARQDKESAGADEIRSSLFSIFVGKIGISEIGGTCFNLSLLDVR